MLKFIISLACLAAITSGGSKEAIKPIHRDMSKFNNDVACWGFVAFQVALYKATEQCMQFGNPLFAFTKPTNPFAPIQQKPFQTLPHSVDSDALRMLRKVFTGSRAKRQAEEGLIETEEADVEEFLANFEDFKGSVASMIANLTCVMTKLQMLDSTFQINMDFYNYQLWENIDLNETLALQDPVWRRMMTTGYNDCYQIAQTIPEESLQKDPLLKVFCRHMIFFNCAKKVQNKCCADAQLYRLRELWYGKDDSSVNWEQFGFPKNKYDKAALSMLVIYDSASEEENFVWDFYNGKSNF